MEYAKKTVRPSAPARSSVPVEQQNHSSRMIQLQRTLGNKGMQRMIHQSTSPGVQRFWNPFKKNTASTAPNVPATANTAEAAATTSDTMSMDVDPSMVQTQVDFFLGQISTWESTSPFPPKPLNEMTSGNMDEQIEGYLSMPEGYVKFLEFAKTEFSAENLYLMHALNALGASPLPEDLHAFNAVFIKSGAPYEANISAPSKKAFQALLNKGVVDADVIKKLRTQVMFNLADTFSRATDTNVEGSFGAWVAPKQAELETLKQKAAIKEEKQAKKDAQQAEANRTKTFADLKIQKRSILSPLVLNKVQEDTLKLTLSDAEGYRLFNAYAEAGYSATELMFLEVLSNFVESPSLSGASSIINLFVREDSAYELNLPASVRKSIVDVIDSPGAMDEDTGIGPSFFDRVLDTVIVDISQLYSRIIGSDHMDKQAEIAHAYRKWLDRKGKQVAKLNRPGFGARVRSLFKRK